MQRVLPPRLQQKRLPPAPTGSCGSWVARPASSQVALPLNGILPKRACDAQEKAPEAVRSHKATSLPPVAELFDSNVPDEPIVETLWTLLLTFCVFLKLPPQFSGEQDVQTIFATVQTRYNVPRAKSRSCIHL